MDTPSRGDRCFRLNAQPFLACATRDFRPCVAVGSRIYPVRAVYIAFDFNSTVRVYGTGFLCSVVCSAHLDHRQHNHVHRYRVRSDHREVRSMHLRASGRRSNRARGHVGTVRCGDPQRKPFTWRGVRYASLTEFGARWGISPQQVARRLKLGITDDRLAARRLPYSPRTVSSRPSTKSRARCKSGNARKRPLLRRGALAADAPRRARQRSVTGK